MLTLVPRYRFANALLGFMQEVYFPPFLRGARGDLIVWIIRYYVKNNFKGNAGHDLLEDLQMPFGVNSAAKASDDEGTHIGEGTDDAPGMQPF
jgi:hypothetical protein